jgi:D-alanyl-D-alanine dipeptidase
MLLSLFSVTCKRTRHAVQEEEMYIRKKDDFQDVSKQIKIDYDTTQWTELTNATEGIILDLRYATTNNFTHRKLYDCARCFLAKQSAIAFLNVVAIIQEKGFQVVLLDCYRPLDIQRKLWEIVPNPNYVANPDKGSTHNRGISVDITLADNSGNYLDMGTEYDHFGKEAYHDYLSLPPAILENRKLLKTVMKSQAFVSTRTEWWHYHYSKDYPPLSNMNWQCE